MIGPTTRLRKLQMVDDPHLVQRRRKHLQGQWRPCKLPMHRESSSSSWWPSPALSWMAMLEWNLASKRLLLWEVLSRWPASRSSRVYGACKHRRLLLLRQIGLHPLLWPKRLA